MAEPDGRISPVVETRRMDAPVPGSILDVIDAIYRTTTRPAEWPGALAAIADFFGDVGAILLYQRDDGSFATIVSPSLVDAQRDYEAYGWKQDICFARATERRYEIGDTITTNDVVSAEEIESHPFFTGFRRKHGLGFFGAVNISPSCRNSVVIAVQRPFGKAEFSSTELAYLQKIGRHAENALRLGVRLLDQQSISASFGEILSRLDIAVFVLDAERYVVFMNSATTTVREAISLQGERFSLRSNESQSALLAVLDSWLHDRQERPTALTKPILLPGLLAKTRHAIYVAPAKFASDFAAVVGGQHFIVLVIPNKISEPADPALIRDLFGLTLSEARLASLIGGGLAPAEAAAELGVKEGTARTALKRIFAKTGASRQSELALMIERFTIG